MSDTPRSKVFMFDNSDPEMQGAYEKAQATFRYFWRELAWERRRIIPALDLACVKAPFVDETPNPDQSVPEAEHMWLSEIDFDGQFISGELLNEPNWLKSVSAGDSVRIPLNQLSDWMYVIGGEAYGGHTVQLMRSRMSSGERRQHDEAWGLSFGNPEQVRLVPPTKPAGGFFKSLFGKREVEPIGEHPMSENMAPALAEKLREDPTMLHSKDENDWTMLHEQALAGSAATVRVLLAAGADRHAVTKQGWTPLQLAKSLKWDNVIALLEAR